MELALIGYDKEGSDLATYTLELAKLLQRRFKVILLSNETLQGVNYKIDGGLSAPSFLPLLASLRGRHLLRDASSEFEIVHVTNPGCAAFIKRRNVVMTRYVYISYLKLAWIRTTKMPLPYNLGGFPVTFQH